MSASAQWRASTQSMNSIYAEDNNAFAFFQVGDDDDSDQAGSSVCVQRDKI